MADDDENQRRVFEFLLAHLESKAVFTREELFAVTDWKGTTPKTYWSKQYRPLLIKVGSSYRVAEVFSRYATWDKFQQHVTQMRRVTSTDYEHSSFERVRIYEFFMPLTNETHLRVALDALFFRDSVDARLSTIPETELRANFPRDPGESDATYTNRLADWISDHFGGYSVYHVSGRFRAMPLKRRSELTDPKTRYLVDETTAVTRFIFPCATDDEADLVAFFFERLFVSAIIEVVNGEDEIWMVETGVKNQLHIWRVKKGA
jgi:hypothetical protein